MKTPGDLADFEAQLGAQEKRRLADQRRRDVLSVRKSLEEQINKCKIASTGGKICVEFYCLPDGISIVEIADINNYLSQWGWTCFFGNVHFSISVSTVIKFHIPASSIFYYSNFFHFLI